MAAAYLVFTICGMIGVYAAVSDALNLELAHGLLGLLFYLLLVVGFMMVHGNWTNLNAL